MGGKGLRGESGAIGDAGTDGALRSAAGRRRGLELCDRGLRGLFGG